mgnify:CR=1 FL=1
MKKVGIVTINDYNNYGNRLQNYAVEKTLEKCNVSAITLKNEPCLNTKEKYLLRKLKSYFNKDSYSRIEDRKLCFEEFNKYIQFSKNKISVFSKLDDYDFFVTGSDQVWNPNFGRLREVDLLAFAPQQKRISFSASFGVKELNEKESLKVKNEISVFKAISVREESGKELIEKITGRKDSIVLLDPTMMLSATEWEEVIKKPKMLKEGKYILNYFLGELSDERKSIIEKIAKDNDCKIINILDINDPFYCTGPSEFLYLEKNAFLICTDSFHSSVFSIIFERPFLVFDREDYHVAMNSRIETLLSKFDLQSRKFNGKLSDNFLNINYENSKKIIEEEKKKTMEFLRKALDI